MIYDKRTALLALLVYALGASAGGIGNSETGAATVNNPQETGRVNIPPNPPTEAVSISNNGPDQYPGAVVQPLDINVNKVMGEYNNIDGGPNPNPLNQVGRRTAPGLPPKMGVVVGDSDDQNFHFAGGDRRDALPPYRIGVVVPNPDERRDTPGTTPDGLNAIDTQKHPVHNYIEGRAARGNSNVVNSRSRKRDYRERVKRGAPATPTTPAPPAPPAPGSIHDDLHAAGTQAKDDLKGAASNAKATGHDLLDQAQNKEQDVKDHTEHALGGAMDATVGFGDEAIHGAEHAGHDVVDKTTTHIDAAKDKGKDLIDDAKKTVNDALGKTTQMLDGAKKDGKVVVDTTVGFGDEAVHGAEHAGHDVVDKTTKDMDAAKDKGKGLVDDAKKSAKNAVAKTKQKLDDAKKDGKEVMDTTVGLGDEAVHGAEHAGHDVVDETTKDMDAAKDKGKGLVDDVKNTAKNAAGKTKQTLDGAEQNGKEVVDKTTQKLNGAKDAVANAAPAVKDTIIGATDAGEHELQGAMAGAKDTLQGWQQAGADKTQTRPLPMY